MPYVPVGTSTQNPGLAHNYNVVHYIKKGLDRLLPKLYLSQLGYQVPLPLNSGKTVQLFRFNSPGANTTPAAEGVVPNPVPQSSYTISATVEQYADYMSSSTMFDLVDINAAGTNQMVQDLSIRGALTADTLVRIELDTNSAYTVNTIGSYFTVADIKFNRALMEGNNVQPYGSGDWMLVIHPFIKYDIETDNTAGGFIDSMKYGHGVEVLNGEVGKAGGARIVTSTNVGNNGAAAPTTKYNCYLFGYQAFATVDLAGKGPKRITDLKNEMFRINVFNPKNESSDPTGEVGTIAAYRFVTATRITDPSRMRIIQADASII